MPAHLNHTVVGARDASTSAAFLVVPQHDAFLIDEFEFDRRGTAA